MSKFLSSRFSFEPYAPGEQPKDMKYLKLNTNESPYPPSRRVQDAVSSEAGKLNLYSDPESAALRKKAAELYGVAPENILPVNGSDEALNFAFLAFCDKNIPIVYPSVSYGFYTVLAGLHGIPSVEIPLTEDFLINPKDYISLHKNIVIANPNAPTGQYMAPDVVETIVRSNPENVVIIDEAYIDFGGETVIPLIKKYPNLIVTRTFSKSHSLAGARLGFAFANEALIADMDMIKYSTNPYNVNRLTSAAGIAAMEDNRYYMENCRAVAEVRDDTVLRLRAMGFTVMESKSNFIFVKSAAIAGGELYRLLRERGILVRHFTKPLLCDYNRISIGTKEQMNEVLAAITSIFEAGR